MKNMKIEALCFKMTKEVFHTCIVPTVPFPGHAGLDIGMKKRVEGVQLIS
ncbi:hypothetical protein J23TS9_09440 [Paenibacillus sp. J23TS9]|nr:hypothetical protein J23TS9_09440 [Paenibacillus sp. J23TS9]